MFKGIVAALIVAIGTASTPPVAAQPCIPPSHYGDVSGGSRDLVREINRRGFDAFSQLGASRGWQDIAVSPFALWYLNRFVDVNWPRAKDAMATVLLRQVSDHAAFSATVWADSNKTTYTTAAALRAQRVFCASTKWAPWSASRVTPQYDSPLKRDLSVVLSLGRSSSFAFPGSNLFARAPAFDDGTLRGLRLDSKDGYTAVYLLWGSAKNVAFFRETMNVSRWDSLASQFRTADVLLDDLNLRRSSYAEWLPDGITSFGTVLTPGFAMQHALVSNQTLTIGKEGVSFAISAALYGNATKPVKITVNGTTHYESNELSVNSDPGSTIPPNLRFSTLEPLVYVVEDRATGAILLIGMHE